MILSADSMKEQDRLLRGKLKSYAGMEHFLYALNKIIEAKQLMIQSEQKDADEHESKDQNLDDTKKASHVDHKLMKSLEKISAEEMTNMEETYKVYAEWLEEEGR